KLAVQERGRELEPRSGICPKEQTDRARPDRAGTPAFLRLWRSQASPANPAGETEPVEPLGLIVFQSQGQQFGLPRRSGQLVAIEQLQHRFEAFGAGGAVLGIDSLPRQQKSLEVGNRDR